MQLIITVAIMATLMISENAPDQCASQGGLRAATIVVGMVFLGAAALCCARAGVYRIEQPPRPGSSALADVGRAKRAFTALWLAVSAAVLLPLGWPQVVRCNWNLERAFLIDDVLILSPVLLPLVLSWFVFYDLDRAARHAYGDVSPWASAGRGKYVGLHGRHYLGVLLVPVFVLLAVQDTAELWRPGVLESDYAAWIYAAPATGLFFAFPVLLRHVWDTAPLPPGPIRDRLLAIAGPAGFRPHDIRVWNTGGMVINAAVAGFLPRLRCVYLTDGLLKELTTDELEIVLGHEVGHVHHRHLVYRVLAMLAPVGVYLAVRQAFPGWLGGLEEQLRDGSTTGNLTLALAGLALLAAHAMLVFGRYSRMLECQADLFGCRRLAAGCPATALATFVSALEKLSAASGTDRRHTTWQHASVASRIEFLHRTADDTALERRFHRRLRWVNAGFAATLLVPILCQLLAR